MFRSGVLQEVIRKSWFGDGLDSPAAVHSAFFDNHLTLPTIALAATAVRTHLLMSTCANVVLDRELPG